MPSLRDIKRRISSVKSTQKITRAMKMVSAAKLRRAQESIERARPYAYHLRDMAARVAERTPGSAHRLLGAPKGDRVALIVLTSDRGLCGGFNATVVNEAMRLLRTDLKDRDVTLTVIGRKGVEALRRRPCTIGRTYVRVLDENRPLRAARDIVEDHIQAFLGGEFDEALCLYNEFKSAISQKLTLERVLPIEQPSQSEVLVDYLYEPSQEAVLGELLRRNLHVQMHRILLESAASEYGARMTAMEAATNNASDVIDRLTLAYNRARQTAITSEVIEIVSGAEAL